MLKKLFLILFAGLSLQNFSLVACSCFGKSKARVVVDITRLDKAAILQELYNHAHLQTYYMAYPEARQLVSNNPGLRFNKVGRGFVICGDRKRLNIDQTIRFVCDKL